MKEEQVENFKKTYVQLKSFHTELSILSKKLPKEELNKFKLGFINSLIADANRILKDDFKPFKNFDTFDIDELPSNSDVVMMISQYLKCFKNFYSCNTTMSSNYELFWIIDGKRSGIKAPSKVF